MTKKQGLYQQKRQVINKSGRFLKKRLHGNEFLLILLR